MLPVLLSATLKVEWKHNVVVSRSGPVPKSFIIETRTNRNVLMHKNRLEYRGARERCASLAYLDIPAMFMNLRS